MTQAAKFFDPVLGIDIHMVVLPPPAPAPVPMPHPFIGVVFDPIGAAIGAAIGLVLGGGGPVLINLMPVGNTGTAVRGVPHFPMPPGVSFAPNDIPGNDGTIVTGSKTVTMGGSSEGRFGSMVMTCNFPINLPTSLCLAIPVGAPVIVGGPDSFDIMAALTQAIRTKWVSNKLHSLLKAAPGSRLSKVICFLTGHPVDVMTGAVLTDAVDFELPGPIPLQFERNYYSRDPHGGALGPGWSHSLEAGVREDPDGLLVQLEDGRRIAHPRLDAGESLWEPVERYTLTRTASGYALAQADGRTLEFARVVDAVWSHPLVAIRDRNDNVIRLEHEAGRLASVTDSAGRKLRFIHDAGGRLVSVRHRRGGAHGKWVEQVRYGFDADGQLAAAHDARGRPFCYAYRGGVLVRETNRNGLAFHFEYDWDHPDGWCTRTWGDGGIHARTITYDKHRHCTLVDDSRGARTHYFGNAVGLVDRMLDAEGGEWKYEWHPKFLRKTAEVDPMGHRSVWSYDERGNLRSATDPLGHVTRWRYDDSGRPVELIDPRGHSWTRSYDERGNLRSATDPLGGTYHYRYDPRGSLVEACDPRGRSLRFDVDGAAQVVAATDREGHTTHHEYDELGRMIRHVGALGGQTHLHWDECGRLIAWERPDGSRVSLDYDPEGNLVRRADSHGHQWRYEYGGHNQLRRQTDPLGHHVGYAYDSEENLVEIRNEHDEPYTFTYDRRGLVAREVGFDGRTHVYEYDRAGRTVAITNGRKQRSQITRDPLGRLTHQIGSDGVWIRFAYDEAGNLSEAVNQHCAVRFERDTYGRVVREHAGEHVVESSHDSLGNRTRRTTSRGHEALYDHDGNGALIRVRVPKPAEDLPPGAPRLHEHDCWEIEIARDADGNEVARRLPGGIESLWERDTMGRPLAHRVVRRPPGWGRAGAALAPAEELLSTTYEWRAEDRLAARHDRDRGTTRYTHDPRGALIAAEEPDGGVSHRAMDAVGNVYRAADRSDRKYGPGGRLLATEDGGHLRHDDDGNTLARVDRAGRAMRFTWDSLSQLTEISTQSGRTYAFQYDALGRRIRRTVRDADDEAEQVEQVVWDGNTPASRGDIDYIPAPNERQILAEQRAGGWTATIFDASDRSLARTSEGELALPRVARDELFGAPRDGAEPGGSCGQFFPPDEGLYYNRFRYYDPEAGRYLSQDPIGTCGGLNLYSHVDDPLRSHDVLGLAEWVNPSALNFSQAYVDSNVDDYTAKMKRPKEKGGWDWSRRPDDHANPSALRVVEVKGKLVSLDNRRLLAAQKAGLEKVPIIKVKLDDLIPNTNTPWCENLERKLFSKPKHANVPKIQLPPEGTPKQPTVCH